MKKLSLLVVSLILLYYCHKEKALTHPAVKDPNYVKAKTFLGKQNDSAFYYFNQVAIAAKDSLQTSYAYNYMAWLQSEEGDYFGSEENLTMSLRYLDTANKENYKSLASTFNELGLTSIQLSHYQDAVHFFDQAIRYSDPDKYRLVFLNNKALATEKKGDYSQSLKIYRYILPQIKEQETYARTLSNMARTTWLQQPNYKAAPELWKALYIRLALKDKWGLNASYSHLSDYYQKSRPDSALYFASKMYAVAQEISSPDDQVNALNKLIKLSPAAKTKVYFQRYQKLNDSLQTARDAAKNRFAYIRYQVERKEADNLKLQKENAEQDFLLATMSLTTIIGLIIVFFGYHWFIRRKRLEKEQAIAETQRKASKKVHDTLANDIYRLMKTFQQAEIPDKEHLIDEIDDIYQRARNLSYEIIRDANEQFNLTLSALITSFATEDTRVLLVGNQPDVWAKTTGVQKTELRYILQELMVNMRKHSGATDVLIKFELVDAHCIINYYDDGIGMKAGTIFNNGLSNTGNRIAGLNGTFNFDDDAGRGLHIQIAFPIV